MTASQLPAADACSLHLLAELEAYEAHLLQAFGSWDSTREVVLFGPSGQSMERMRKLAAGRPAVSADWLLVMISHTELMHNLWRASVGESIDAASELREHLACVQALANACRRYLQRDARTVRHAFPRNGLDA